MNVLSVLYLQKSFSQAPDRPSGMDDVGVVMNDQQQKMLQGLGAKEVEEEDVEDFGTAAHTCPPGRETAGVEMNKKERRFFALFQNAKSMKKQASIPEDVDLAKVHPGQVAEALPTVWDTDQEKEAKKEDLARRSAYLEKLTKESVSQTAKMKEAHDRFVSTFDSLKTRE